MMNKVYEKYDNDWELIKYEPQDLTERLPTIGGWIVRNRIWDDKKDMAIAISMIFISDPKHDWDIPCDNSHIEEKNK